MSLMCLTCAGNQGILRDIASLTSEKGSLANVVTRQLSHLNMQIVGESVEERIAKFLPWTIFQRGHGKNSDKFYNPARTSETLLQR